MKKLNQLLCTIFCLAISSLACANQQLPHQLFHTQHNKNDCPAPRSCKLPIDPHSQAEKKTFCNCFEKQSIVGCKYEQDCSYASTWTCSELFVDEYINDIIPSEPEAIYKFCSEHQNDTPARIPPEVCRDSLVYYKNNCI